MRSLKLQAGAEIAEFAVTLPVILIFVYFLVEFGAALTDRAVLADVSRAAARAAISTPPGTTLACSGESSCDCGDPVEDPVWCTAYEVFSATEANFDDASAFIWWNRPDGPKPTITVTTPTPAVGQPVTARAEYQFQLWGLSALGVGTGLRLSASTTMRKLPD